MREPMTHAGLEDSMIFVVCLQNRGILERVFEIYKLLGRLNIQLF